MKRILVFAAAAALFTASLGRVAAAAQTQTTYLFNYPDRAALLNAGWNFLATNTNGTARDTESAAGSSPPDVSYDQAGHPGALRLPVDAGDLWASVNNTRNSLFRSLPTNWVSARLQLGFAPGQNFQQSGMVIYQDDDNFVEANFGFNSGTVHAALLREFNGSPVVINGVTVTLTNLILRLDRELGNGDISGYYSGDGTNWSALGSVSQGLVNPRLGFWTGGSTGGFPNADLLRVDVITTNAPVTTALLAQPQALVFNATAGRPCATVQQVRLVHRGPDPLTLTVSGAANWLSLTANNGPANGAASSSTDVSVNTAGLAAGTYLGTLNFSAPGPLNGTSSVAVTLIVNPASRARVATWRGARSGAMTVWVDDSNGTAYDTLRAGGFTGTYLFWGLSPIPGFTTNYFNSGMEIGAHTVDHPCYFVNEAALRYEITGNLAAILGGTPEPAAQLISFAWPCGITRTNDEATAADYFMASRGYNLNLLEDPSPRDFMNLKSFNSHEHDARVYNPAAPASPADFKTIVDAAIAQGKWYNLVLHGLLDDDGAILYAVGRDIWVAPAGAVTKYIAQRDRAVIGNYAESNGVVRFDFSRLPISASPLRSFESAVTADDVLTLQVDLSGIARVTGLTVNGIGSTNYVTCLVAGKPTLLFDTVVTGSPQALVLSVSTNLAQVLTVAADPQGKVYGAADPPLTCRITSGALAGGDGWSGSLARTPGENAGDHPIRQGTLSAGANYTIYFAGTNLTVTPRTLTARADNQSRAYGLTNPVLTVTFLGFVGADRVADIDRLPVASTTARPDSPSGTYPITLTGGGDDNYNLSLVNATFTVLGEAPPMISLRLAGGMAITTWNASAGKTYRLQYNDTLAGTNWADVPPDVTATGLTAGATSPMGNSRQRSYRVWVKP